MPKAKLSQIATTWVDEKSSLKKRGLKYVKAVETEKTPKKKQTFNLKVDTIKRLWLERIRTDKPLSEILDEMVIGYLPAVNLEILNKKREK